MLYSKDWILIHNLRVLKGYDAKKLIYSFHKRDGICAVWIILLTRCEKPAQQIYNSYNCRQWQTSHTSRTAENIDAVNDLVLS